MAINYGKCHCKISREGRKYLLYIYIIRYIIVASTIFSFNENKPLNLEKNVKLLLVQKEPEYVTKHTAYQSLMSTKCLNWQIPSLSIVKQ